MYIPCFVQVVFPYLKIIKNEKRVKVLKEISKELEKNRPQKKKEIKIIHESEQVKMPLLFTFTVRIMIMCILSINSIIHDHLNSLILTFHALNFMF